MRTHASGRRTGRMAAPASGRRSRTVGATVVLVAAALACLVLPIRTAAAGPVVCPASMPDRPAAVAAARACGGRVLISDETSETQLIWAESNGSFTTDQS